MHDDLDDLLSGAARPLATRSPELERTLSQMVADSERLARPGRRRWLRWAGAGVAGVIVIGGGVTAGAATIVPTPSYGNTWADGPATLRETRTLPSGATCRIEYEVEPVEATSGVGEAEWQATIEASHAFLEKFDLSSISVPDALAREQAARRRLPSVAAGERPPEPTPDDLVLNAVTMEIYRQLATHLGALGLPAQSVDIGEGSVCDRSIE